LNLEIYKLVWEWYVNARLASHPEPLSNAEIIG
jgi:hypothetical protein